jgi:hypothetical protein
MEAIYVSFTFGFHPGAAKLDGQFWTIKATGTAQTFGQVVAVSFSKFQIGFEN